MYSCIFLHGLDITACIHNNAFSCMFIACIFLHGLDITACIHNNAFSCMFIACIFLHGLDITQGCIQKFYQGGGANLGYVQKRGRGGEAYMRCYTLYLLGGRE